MHRFNQFHLRIFLLTVLLLSLTGLTSTSTQARQAAPAAFGSGLGVCAAPLSALTPNNPEVVTNCTQAGLQAALNQGGQIVFNCGPAPVTIPLSSPLELSTQADTLIDGGGLVTLDGQGVTRILHKGWHDPNTVGTVLITLQNLRLINGKAPAGASGEHSGGALYAGHPGTRLHILNTTFENNTTTEIHVTDNQGGAIFVHNAYETIIVGSQFSGNSAGNGGAFGGIATGLLVYNSRFIDNHALDNASGGVVRGYGGALHLDGVENGYNPDSNNTVTICGSIFEGNTAIRGGGASVVTVSDGLNTQVIYTRSTFANNEVFGLNGEFGQGGAIYHIEDDHTGGRSEQNFEISASTFHANRAYRQGGAIWVYFLGHGLVINSTFAANTTTAPLNQVGQGGAAAVTLGVIDFTNVTFANNHAAYQAGALHGGGTGNPDQVVTLTNTIFYNNTLNEQELPSPTRWQGYHTNRPMTDGGQNIQYPRYKPTYNNDVNNNITASPIYLDPQLLPLGAYGGPTYTIALAATSPAINIGAPACLTIDQRGYPRLGQCDLGAFEFGASLAPGLRTFLPVARK